MKIIALSTVLIVIFYLLKWVSELLEDSFNALAFRLAIPASVAGATFLAIGSSAPEFFTSFSSAVFQGIFEIGLMTIIWSAIFNVLVITAFSGILAKKKLKLAKKGTARDLVFYLATILLLFFFLYDQVISQVESFIFLIFYALYIFVLFLHSKKKDQHEDLQKISWPINKIIFVSIIGIIAIGFLCWLMIETGIYLASQLDISLHIISALIFASGTSLPDLFLSVSAARKGSGSAAISNIFGSNTFDIALGLSVPILIVGDTKIVFSEIRSSIFMLFLSVILVAILIFKNWRIAKIDGYICLFTFIVFVFFLLFN